MMRGNRMNLLTGSESNGGSAVLACGFFGKNKDLGSHFPRSKVRSGGMVVIEGQ